MKCIHCGKDIIDGAENCTYCNAEQRVAQPAEAREEESAYHIRLYSQPETPMIWYRSIIYFWILVAALVDMVTGALLLATTTQHSDIFWKYPLIEVAVGVFGFLWLIRAGFAFFVRSRLADYHKKAIRLFFGYQVAGLLLPVLLWLAIPHSADVRPVIFFGIQTYINIGLSAFMILTSILYFKKRKSMFEDTRPKTTAQNF
ncbi:MAG: hypothetical protein ACOYIR_08445 [Christensenellales bacterium]|jgi:hypothetical protein